jgi:redox-sensitive bicupin YhaK (pirin superfamily)
MFGLQLWVGLPQRDEETEPSFRHYPAQTMPELEGDGALLRVFAGSAYGVTSPVKVSSPLFAVAAVLEPGARLRVPDGHEERAVYVIEGGLERGTNRLAKGTLAVFTKGSQPELKATAPSRVVMLGGAPLDGPRFMFWNFVSSSKESIVEASRAWKEGRFAKRIPGDDVEFVPLTMEPRFSTH